MGNNWLKKSLSIFISLLLGFSLVGCVNQHPNKSVNLKDSDDVKTLLEISDPIEKAAVEVAKKKVKSLNRQPRIIATSSATAEFCDKLGIELVGVPQTTVSKIPERYQGLKKIGTPMSPDMEIVASLKLDWILSPVSLQGDLQPKYEAIKTDYAFLNLNSVPGMYRSIQELGEIFGKEKEAKKLVEEFTGFYENFKIQTKGKKKPKVFEAIKKRVNNIKEVTHEEFKVLTKDSKAVVRTGECSPYANIILKSGVVF